MFDKVFARAVAVVFLVVLLVPATADTAEPDVLGSGNAHDDQPCVLMVNQNVLFGTAQQRGEFVIVRRDDDSEIQLSRKDVACWAPSIRGLYQYRADHRHDGSLEAHVESARWCLRYGLLDLATKELQTTRRIAPGNAQSNRLEQQIARAAEVKMTGPVVRDPTKPIFDQSTVQLVAHAETVTETTFDPLTLKLFARHIQPLLTNRCGRCHASESDRTWRMQSAIGGSRASANMSRSNLSATMPYVKVGRPFESELYRRAIDGHAGKNSTLGPHAVVATRALEQWLRAARTVNTPDHQPTAPAFAPPTSPRESAPPTSPDEPAHDATSAAPAEESKRVARLPQVSNPFDPELFNKRFHGAK